METRAEWMKNKDHKRFFPISHAKAILRGKNSTVDADLSKIESDVKNIKHKLSNLELYVDGDNKLVITDGTHKWTLNSVN